jgi:hypothetical protein
MAVINKRHPDDVTPTEQALLLGQRDQNFTEWDKRLWDRNGYTVGFNHLMSENQVQWGHRAGINSGNGQHECRMDMHLFLQLGASKYPEDPDWWKDDHKFYSFLRSHPELDSRPGKNNPRGEKFLTRQLANVIV